MLPGDTQQNCFLVLDLVNRTHTEMELQYTERKSLLIEPGDMCRVPVPVVKCSFSDSLEWDGAGGQAVYNMADSLEINSSHMVFAGLSVNRFDQDGKVLWLEPTPGSHDAERPLAIIPAKESAELNKVLADHLESGMAKLKAASPIHVEYDFDDKMPPISVAFDFSCKGNQVRKMEYYS